MRLKARPVSRLPALIAEHHPRLIIICHGANDILRKLDLKKTRNNIQQMIDIARKNNSEVVLVAVPQFSLFLSPEPMYHALTEKNQVPVTKNILSEIIVNNALKSDHVHPNTQGYQLLAQDIASLLKSSGAFHKP